MACCAHVRICHAILTAFSRRLGRPRPRSKSVYYYANLKLTTPLQDRALTITHANTIIQIHSLQMSYRNILYKLNVAASTVNTLSRGS
jgi:hypothetical protein